MALGGISLKIILVIIGLVLSIIGITLNNWKIAAIGNCVAVVAILLS